MDQTSTDSTPKSKGMLFLVFSWILLIWHITGIIGSYAGQFKESLHTTSAAPVSYYVMDHAALLPAFILALLCWKWKKNKKAIYPLIVTVVCFVISIIVVAYRKGSYL